MKVLIADDHALFRDGLSLRLEKIEPKSVIFQAANFTQALKILDDEKKIDLVILDLDMPDMNWEEGLAELRQKANGARYLIGFRRSPQYPQIAGAGSLRLYSQTFRTENSDQCPAVDFRRRNLFAAFRA